MLFFAWRSGAAKAIPTVWSPGDSPPVVVKFTQTLGAGEGANLADVLYLGPLAPEARAKPPADRTTAPAFGPDATPGMSRARQRPWHRKKNSPDQLVSCNGSLSEHPLRHGRQHRRAYIVVNPEFVSI
jgi:hypothetical protein